MNEQKIGDFKAFKCFSNKLTWEFHEINKLNILTLKIIRGRS
jgi:hypothetical protein